jgi:hypothetical protein
MGVNLITFATERRAGMEQREAEDVINDFGRDPIGESKDEKVCLLTLRYFQATTSDPPSEIQQAAQFPSIAKEGRRHSCTGHWRTK